MQTLDPSKLGSCLGSSASGVLNFPLPSMKFSKTPHPHPSGAQTWLELVVLSGHVPWAWVGADMSQSLFSPCRLLSSPLPCTWGGSNTSKSSGTCACGVIVGPQGWAAAAWWVSIQLTGTVLLSWDETELLEWCWHSNFEWFSLTWTQDEFRTLSSQQPTAEPWVWAACVVSCILNHPS